MNVLGQDRAVAVLESLLSEAPGGRTIILNGPDGVGKTTLALESARAILGCEPFTSPDFLYYRNDAFNEKLAFLQKLSHSPEGFSRLASFHRILLGRFSAGLSVGEWPKSALKLQKTSHGSSGADEFRAEWESALVSENRLAEAMQDASFAKNIETIAGLCSDKARIPIDFIRSMIAFHAQKPVGSHRVTVIGNFENATEEAQNSSLKLFEEPSENGLILLTVSELPRVLPTILSRSVVIQMNPLSPEVLRKLFGGEAEESAVSTRDCMEEALFRISEKREALVNEFFTRIAPRVQYGIDWHSFIERLGSGDRDLTVDFLEELLEFFRLVHLYRQESLRGVSFGALTRGRYVDIALKLVGKSYTSEMRDIVRDIQRCLGGIRYGNQTPAFLLPALLIDIARWYQKRAARG